MPDYNNSKIYKIEPVVEHKEGEIYIGSTTKLYLSQRMAGHAYDYRKWKDGSDHKFTCYDLFDKYGIENCKIDLIEYVKATSKDELLSKESYYIRTLKYVSID